MKLIEDNFPEFENGEGNIIFEMNGYVYNIGQTEDNTSWISRQSIYDYENGNDGWEAPVWYPENQRQIKLLRGTEFVCKDPE